MLKLPENCTLEEVAEYLRMPTRTVRDLCNKFEMLHFRPTPNRIVIRREHVEEFMLRKVEQTCQKRTKAHTSPTEKTEEHGAFWNTSEGERFGTLAASLAEQKLRSLLQNASCKTANVTRIQSGSVN